MMIEKLALFLILCVVGCSASPIGSSSQSFSVTQPVLSERKIILEEPVTSQPYEKVIIIPIPVEKDTIKSLTYTAIAENLKIIILSLWGLIVVLLSLYWLCRLLNYLVPGRLGFTIIIILLGLLFTTSLLWIICL